MTRDFLDKQRRAGTLATVVALHGLALFVLLTARGVVTLPLEIATPIDIISVTEPPPVPPPPVLKPERKVEDPRQKRAEGAAAQIARIAVASPIQAIESRIVLPITTPIVAATIPSIGTQASQGAAEIDGPGTGAGGSGTGTGSGNAGSGPGGTGAGVGTPPRQIAGIITRRDYPRELRESRVPVEVINLQFTVGTDGYVRDCTITRSSGSALLDERTCQLYESRLRFEPARDATGRPEPALLRATRSWFIVR